MVDDASHQRVRGAIAIAAASLAAYVNHHAVPVLEFQSVGDQILEALAQERAVALDHAR